MSARQRVRDTIREEDEDYWCHGCCDMDQDVMEDVEEEAQVDQSLYTSSSPTFGSSPTTYALTDPFLAHQLQAAEQRTRQQPSFFAQIATAQQGTSPFYTAAHQSPQQQQQPSSTSMEMQPIASIFPPSRPAPNTLTIDTGSRLIPVDAARIH